MSQPTLSFTPILISVWVMPKGSMDGTIRLWEVATTRCLRVWNAGEAVLHVAWNPLHDLPILAAAV